MNQVSNSSRDIKYLQLSQTADLEAGELQTTVLNAPEGKIWKLIALYLKADSPAGSNSGKHAFFVQPDGLYIPVLEGKSEHMDPVEFKGNEWSKTSTYQIPQDDETNVLNALRTDSSQGIRIQYSNATDVSQTNTRTINAIVEEEDVNA
ncbi:hypothetical protein E4P24_02050 [Haloferax sp. AS1]|uniref:Uncharacterized protein n=1 Tax=Haloferax volcanii TaxID=2246 RepID=A0A558FN75_HALVO|nr:MULTISPECIES: hypothetical protein [Haloferax]MBC9985155.1 hypothetical protein [Haloferax sp. AS1]TVT86919.1 hypothetical protein FQA18_19490 [Haloferax volcanii]